MAIAPFAMGPGKQPDSGTNNPPLMSDTANTASAIYKGSILLYSSNILVAATGNPTAGTIVGVAAAPNQWTPGYNMANQPTTVDFRQNKVPFYRASTDTVFMSHIVNNSDVYITPVLADVGVAYGFRLLATGEWAIDKSLTTTDARARIIRIDTEFGQQIVEWQFLSTAVLTP